MAVMVTINPASRIPNPGVLGVSVGVLAVLVVS